MVLPNDPLRVLLVGCGGIMKAHLPAFEAYPDRLRLVAACDPSERARNAVVQRLSSIHEARPFASQEEAIEQLEGEIDAAVVTTPHFLHFPQAAACVEAGIPVLIEKPVCNNLEETRRLLNLSRKRNVLVVAGQNRRYDLRALWLKKWIRENPSAFGELRSFDIRGWQNIEAWIAGKPDKNADFWILDKARAGGGVVVSLLVHYLDMVRHLTGLDYIEVSAHGRRDPPFRNGAESSCCALLKLSNGAVGTMHANYLVRKGVQPTEVFNLIGENGFIGNGNGWQYASTYGEEPTDMKWQFKGIESVPEDPSLAPDKKHFVSQLLAFAEAIRTGRKPMSHIEENFNTMAVIDAIYTSMQRGGGAVPVDSI